MKNKKIIINICISIVLLMLGSIIIYKKLKSKELFNTLLPRINQTNEYIDNKEIDKASKALDDLKENSNNNSKVIKQIILIEKRLDNEKKKQIEIAKKQELEQLEKISKINQLLNEEKLNESENLIKELSNKNVNDNIKIKLRESQKLLEEKKYKIQMQNKISKIEVLVKNNKLTEAEKEIKEIDVSKLSKDNLNKIEHVKKKIKKKKEDNSAKNTSKNLGQLRKTILGYSLIAPSDKEKENIKIQIRAGEDYPLEYKGGDAYFSAIGTANFKSPDSTMIKPNILYKGKPAYKVTLYLACAYIEGATGYSEFVIDIDGVQYQGNELRNAINSNQVLDINTKNPVEFNPGKIKDY